MTKLLQQFIDNVMQIKREKPTYRQPGDASDGTCDCIGLIIGALKRMGIAWNGIHGTNYTARQAAVNLKKITSASQLSVGDGVLKAYEKGDKKWTLDKYPRYLSGGKYYNGDLKDYYHVGVVTSVNPLGITHMTSPTVCTDTKLGKWGYVFQIKPLANKGAYEQAQPATEQATHTPQPTAEVSGDSEGIFQTPPHETHYYPNQKTAVVTAPSGKTVKMRKKPSTSCSVYDDVKIGSTVQVEETGAEWCKISYGKRKNWYMMTKFLKF